LPQASPLPTWSVLLGRGSLLPDGHRPQVARTVPLAGIVLLEKACDESVTGMRPIEAVAPLYRALCEHPAVLPQRTLFSAALFHCACELARSVPVWVLELTRHGRFWEALAEVV
jgi:hypothetical protein